MKGDRYIRQRKISRKRNAMLVSLIIIFLLTLSVGATLTFLIADTEPVTNTFLPPNVNVEVDEEFDGIIKKNVTIINESDVAVFVRMKLVAYRVDKNGRIIGITEAVPTFTPGNGWLKDGDTYYYSNSLAKGTAPAYPLIGVEGINLKTYEDGSRQVVEIMAEAIQAEPTDAVENAWAAINVVNGKLVLNDSAARADLQ